MHFRFGGSWTSSRHEPARRLRCLIVGAGLAGSVLAERLARDRESGVLVGDKRTHIGGNAYDHHEDGACSCTFTGRTFFHTNSLEVFDDCRGHHEAELTSIECAYYPILRPANAPLYALATYRYYNKDQVVGQALTLQTFGRSAAASSFHEWGERPLGENGDACGLAVSARHRTPG